ncbi:hypothetical protein SDC9_111293 [bioreactor metagenome]|uniref:Uncharacterized protein n=1 Tax=bioreactor metagenome TaxID=1076179 RepID=A0A645BGD6_9ZZZZ
MTRARILPLRTRRRLQIGQPLRRLQRRFAAHCRRSLQAAAAGGPLRSPENAATPLGVEMATGYACRFGERGDRRGDAASTAAGAADGRHFGGGLSTGTCWRSMCSASVVYSDFENIRDTAEAIRAVAIRPITSE